MIGEESHYASKTEELEEYLDFCDVLIRPNNTLTKVNSRSDVNLEVRYTNGNLVWSGIPICASNMDVIGTFEVERVLSKFKMLTILHKFYTVEDFKKHEYDSEYIGISAGISEKELQNISEILEYDPKIKFICLDVANGYTQAFHECVSKFRRRFSDKFIMAGNVVTNSGCQSLVNVGADFIKFGIGSGSVCTTRIKTGIGVPQFSALLNLNDVYDVVSDGGCTSPGDVAKAFGAGARFVMLGGMFAGHNETGTTFYGMSSKDAMDKYSGGVSNYKTSEGKRVDLYKHTKPLEETVLDILGGLRSACTYVGASNLTELIGKQKFIKVRRQYNNIFS
jgi:GMP reductase